MQFSTKNYGDGWFIFRFIQSKETDKHSLSKIIFFIKIRPVLLYIRINCVRLCNVDRYIYLNAIHFILFLFIRGIYIYTSVILYTVFKPRVMHHASFDIPTIYWHVFFFCIWMDGMSDFIDDCAFYSGFSFICFNIFIFFLFKYFSSL